MAKGRPDELEEAFAQASMSGAVARRLLAYLRPYRRVVGVNLVLTVLATVSGLAGPKIIQVGIDRFLASGMVMEQAMHGVAWISLVYLLNLAVGWGVSLSQVRTAIAAGQGAMNDLRMEVFEHIQKLSLSYFDRTHQGRIMARADSDIDSLDRILTWGATQMISSSLTLVGVVVLMLQYEWRLCLAVTLVVPPLVLATRWFHRAGMKAHRAMRAQASRITSVIAENINGVRVVQAYAREEENLVRFREIHDRYGEAALEGARVFHTYMPLVFLCSGGATAILLGYGGSLVMQGSLSVGELAAFVLYLGMFFGPIQTMGDLYNAVLSTAASCERIFQLLDTAPQVVDRPDAAVLPGIRGHVEFRDVSFRYESTPAERWVLEGIRFEAKPGQTIALVGATGSGKTSIISLLARFYEPQTGVILVDGCDIGSVTTASLHEQIGIVTQDNFLFTGTVMENLKFGRPDATDAEVIEASVHLGADKLIRAWAKGYETRLGEKGVNLSAGERQLLCFVRAMVARPRILILDEATSAVDPQTESILQHALETLFEQRTSFVIAHRLSTVRRADLILVLQEGKILERGTHEELLRLGGAYARLHAEFVRV